VKIVDTCSESEQKLTGTGPPPYSWTGSLAASLCPAAAVCDLPQVADGSTVDRWASTRGAASLVHDG
jgi:hypothetical protein